MCSEPRNLTGLLLISMAVLSNVYKYAFASIMVYFALKTLLKPFGYNHIWFALHGKP